MVTPLCRTRPLLPLYLCQLLLCLDMSGLEFWRQCGLRDYSQANVFRNSCEDIAQRGAFLLHCEMLAKQLDSTLEDMVAKTYEQLRTLQSGWYEHFVQLSSETPVQRLFRAIVRTPSVKEAFLDNLLSHLDPDTTCQSPSSCMRLNKYFDSVPTCQAVFGLLGKTVLLSPFLAVRRAAEAVFVKHLSQLAAGSPEAVPKVYELYLTVAAGSEFAMPTILAEFHRLGIAKKEHTSLEALMKQEPEEWLVSVLLRPALIKLPQGSVCGTALRYRVKTPPLCSWHV